MAKNPVIPLTKEQLDEVVRCHQDELYFIENFCKIQSDGDSSEWIPFQLWPSQKKTLQEFIENRLVVALKARQLGMTWLALALILHRMLFRPIQSVLLFSLRETEAVALLDDRLKGMYEQLPEWMRSQAVEDNTREWTLENGSVARAFPANRGDSYTGSFVLIDEADLIPNLNKLLRSVKPTIDAGGRMILLSRSDKDTPLSTFKNIFRAAVRKLNKYFAVFLPWFARPDRTQEWYEEQCADAMARSGSLDDVYEQYPATPEEALGVRTQDKRINPKQIEKVFVEMDPIEEWVVEQAFAEFNAKRVEDEEDELTFPPTMQGYHRMLRIFKLPEENKRYIIGQDSAEGNPTSDDSAFTILDESTLEQVLALNAKEEITEFAEYINALGEFYNRASVLPERNNHGHATIVWLRQNSFLHILTGEDEKLGWLTTRKAKAQMYAKIADVVRNCEITIHDEETKVQLASVDGRTLSAPEGMHDDLAVSICLAVVGAEKTGFGVMR